MENTNKSVLQKYSKASDAKRYAILNEEMTYSEYLDRLMANPRLARNSYQYIYDMIMSKGVTTFEKYRKTYIKYNFFNDPEIPIFGLVETLDAIVNFIHGAAGGYGTEKRILVLRGPVGSSKSTICRLLKRGLEKYSCTDDGSWYSYKWVNLPTDPETGIYNSPECDCPMHEDPLKLMETADRNDLFKDLNERFEASYKSADGRTPYVLRSEGESCPKCRLIMKALLKKYNGEWIDVVQNHVKVLRMTHSEIDRIGVGTFQPKDEKNQDSTELTGDMNFRQISFYGKDSDPRAFNFDGELCIANRGICEFIEMLKLATEFLYDLLGVAQEHNIKPKKFSQIAVDEMVIGHSNIPDWDKLTGNKFMEAFKDRTVKVDVPYLLELDDELKVLESTYGKGKMKHHIMPHTLEIAAFFAILTRLYEDKDAKLDLRDKVKLYNGRQMPGWTEDSVKELRDKYPDEGMKGGVSVRYIQDKISLCLAKNPENVSVFHVLSEIKSGLHASSLIDKENIAKYEVCVDLAVRELDDILKNEVQKALVADKDLVVRLCAKYIDNVCAYVNKEKIINPITNREQAPDERLMRSIEEKIDIPETGANDFRRSITTFLGTLSARKKEFRWDSDPELKRALEAKIFEDTKDTIKLSALSSESGAADPKAQEKIDAIKARLIRDYGYNEKSATDILGYVSSIFARGTSSN